MPHRRLQRPKPVVTAAVAKVQEKDDRKIELHP
jgi:hypothetical protein